MSSAAELIETVRAAGVRLSVHGDKLHVSPPPGMDTAALRQKLAGHKAELLEALKAKTCDRTTLQARCKIACEGLPIEPTALYESMSDDDRGAQLSGEEGPEVLRTYAESICEGKQRERGEPELPAGVSRAYTRLGRTLAEHPDIKRAVEVVDPDSDPVLLAIAVRGCGYVTLKTPRKQYDGFKLLELSCRWNPAKSESEGVLETRGRGRSSRYGALRRSLTATETRLKRKQASLQRIRAKYPRIDYYPDCEAYCLIKEMVDKGYTWTDALNILVCNDSGIHH